MNAHDSLFPRIRRSCLGALALGALLGSARAQTVVTYDASSGTFPEQPCWKLVDSASPEEPLLANGKLVLGTSANAENMYYSWDSELFFPGTFVFEVRLKFVSGSSSASARAPVMIAFTMAPIVGNALCIDQDEIFVLASNSVKGSSAVVDTDGAFHTYRIEVTGTTTGSLLEVYYDAEATPRIQDVLINDAAIASPKPRLYFGEASIHTFGTSEWELVSHNAGPLFCCGQANSCGNNEQPGSVGVASGGTYDASNGDTWNITLGGVPAAPAPGLLIYGFGSLNPATPITTTFGNLCLSQFFRATVALPDVTSGGCANPTQYSWSNWSPFVDVNKAAGTKGFSAAGIDELWIQAWHRDPLNPGSANFSQLAGPFYVAP